VSLSIDPAETAQGLAAFRARLDLPPTWHTVRAADPLALGRTLRALDFHTITVADGVFEHPNLVAVVDELTGGIGGGVVELPPLSRVKEGRHRTPSPRRPPRPRAHTASTTSGMPKTTTLFVGAMMPRSKTRIG
jgi:hypothetical protein